MSTNYSQAIITDITLNYCTDLLKSFDVCKYSNLHKVTEEEAESDTLCILTPDVHLQLLITFIKETVILNLVISGYHSSTISAMTVLQGCC